MQIVRMQNCQLFQTLFRQTVRIPLIQAFQELLSAVFQLPQLAEKPLHVGVLHFQPDLRLLLNMHLYVRSGLMLHGSRLLTRRISSAVFSL